MIKTTKKTDILEFIKNHPMKQGVIITKEEVQLNSPTIINTIKSLLKGEVHIIIMKEK